MVEEKSRKNLPAQQARMGGNFHKEIIKIQGERMSNGKSKERVSTEKITNMIARHNDWKKISKDIINSEEEEINTYGK